MGFRVWDLGFWGSWLQGLGVLEIRGLWFLGLGFWGFGVLEVLGFRFLSFRGFRGFRGFGVQGFRVYGLAQGCDLARSHSLNARNRGIAGTSVKDSRIPRPEDAALG